MNEVYTLKGLGNAWRYWRYKRLVRALKAHGRRLDRDRQSAMTACPGADF